MLFQGVSSFPKLETLASSEYAKHIRFILFDIEDMDMYIEVDEDEDEENHKEIDKESFGLSDQALIHLSSLLAEFRNLTAFDVWADEFTPLNKAIGFYSHVFTTIADLQHRGFIHRVTNLRMPIDGATHLLALLDNSGHQPAIHHFLQNIQHLDLIGFIDYVVSVDAPRGLTDLDTLIKSSPNLLSLSMLGDSTSISLVQSTPGLKLRLESLDLSGLKISSHDLLALLEACKDSMRLISLENIDLLSGSWLHILVQVKKNLLKLITFIFMQSDPYLEELEDGESRYQHCVLWHALGDIQHQTNENRIAAGLKPWTSREYFFLGFPSLEASMKKEYYEELVSRNWDA